MLYSIERYQVCMKIIFSLCSGKDLRYNYNDFCYNIINIIYHLTNINEIDVKDIIIIRSHVEKSTKNDVKLQHLGFSVLIGGKFMLWLQYELTITRIS